MIIAYNELMQKIELESTSRSGWFANYSEISDKDISVLMLCILYHNKIISRESFIARMSQYFKTTQQRTTEKSQLARRVGTYNSKIIDKWFSDISMTNILIEEVNYTCNTKDLTIEQYLTYLNLGFNRNKNYCVDFLGIAIFSKLINGYDTEYISNFLDACDIQDLKTEWLSYENADRMYDLSSGYCCSDCDGCLGQYKRSRYDSMYKRDYQKNINCALQKVLLSYKTHKRNEHCKITYNFHS